MGLSALSWDSLARLEEGTLGQVGLGGLGLCQLLLS